MRLPCYKTLLNTLIYHLLQWLGQGRVRLLASGMSHLVSCRAPCRAQLMSLHCLLHELAHHRVPGLTPHLAVLELKRLDPMLDTARLVVGP